MNSKTGRNPFVTLICAVSLFSLVAMWGCSTAGSGGNLACTGSTCTCPAGENCDISDSDCSTDSCSLDCIDFNECTGSCGASCSVDCSEGSLCEITVGNSGSVSCTNGSECNISCTGNCSLSCSNDSICTLTCAGDDAPQPVEDTGQCTI